MKFVRFFQKLILLEANFRVFIFNDFSKNISNKIIKIYRGIIIKIFKIPLTMLNTLKFIDPNFKVLITKSHRLGKNNPIQKYFNFI